MKIAENIVDKNYLFDKLINKLSKNIHVSIPAIITDIDYEKQTCKAQAVIREYVGNEDVDNPEYVDMPEFMDIPFFILSGGDYAVTMPIKKDDECLIVFADSCIDSWWQSGGIQNPIEIRNHDLSDCFALVGFRSQDKKLKDFDDEAFQIRQGEEDVPFEINDDSIILTKEDCEIKIDEDEINISKGDNVEIKIDSSNNVSIKSNGKIQLNGDNGIEIKQGGKIVDFFSHIHYFYGEGAVLGVAT